MKNNRNLMDEEIEIRLDSDSWDRSIASRVITIHGLKSERWLFSGSVASLAAAAIAVAVFIFNFYPAARISGSGQVSAYSRSSLQDDYSRFSDTSSTEIDSLINEIYPMR